MKILITGGSGLLGANVSKDLKDKHEIVATHYDKSPVAIKGVGLVKLNIVEQEAVNKIIRKVSPELVIHAAAITDSGFCEQNNEEAYAVNVDGTKNVAEAAENVKAKLIYLSTGFVFDGKKGLYKEQDIPNPLSYYSKTKLEGEKVLQQFPNQLIFRTDLYGWNILDKLSFAEWIIDNLGKKQQINLYSNIFFSPILVNDLSEIFVKAAEKDLKGIHNVAGSERASRLGFAEQTADIFALDKTFINPVVHEDPLMPEDTSIDCSKIQKALSIKLPNIKDGLVRMKKIEGYLK